MNSKYTIPAIPQNLSKEETIVQIAEVLDHLKVIMQDIFVRVNSRLETDSQKLADISKRIDVASSKVEQLKGAKKATRVFSSCKYPAVDVKRDYVSIFKDGPDINLERRQVNSRNYSSVYEPLTKLQFFHVKIHDQKEDTVMEGLGDIPRNIKWVNDLLLFNSGKNLYKEFILADSLKGPEVIRDREYISASELGAAPLSISQRSSLQQTNKENYFYTPKIEELPVLDVPLDLPDLPGIADDLRYEIDVGSSIAPSVISGSQIPDVPLELPNVLEIKNTPEDVPLVPPPPPLPSHDIAKDPPPPNDLPLFVEQPSDKNSVPSSAIDSLPVPPQTPPQRLQIINSSQVDSRANLMEAIRKAGGSQNAKLKKIDQEQKPLANKDASSSGDLMADLHSKLMMRRKGISGAKGAQNATPDSTLARISSMIPPPVPKSEVESGVSTDDDDWND